jgi:hypothetical protein
MQDIENFRKSRRRYARLGVPYHRGYLFHGPPGTGKTSLVSALAANFGLSIYAINLAVFNDRSLMNAISQVSPNSIMLFEDIDCMQSGNARVPSNACMNDGARSPDEKNNAAARNGVTLSGLLNVLDGFYAPTNVLFMMTTNRIEALDEALLRPGRIDYKLYLGKASDCQKIELYRRFFPSVSQFEAEAYVEAHAWAETMAEFQGLLLGTERSHGSRKRLKPRFQSCAKTPRFKGLLVHQRLMSSRPGSKEGFMSTLSSRSFLERALHELREIRDEVIDLATDHDIYWKVEHEVIQRNHRLLMIRSAFFDMLNDAYSHSAAMRVRRLVDKDNRTIPLRKLLEELKKYPELLEGQVADSELVADCAELDFVTAKVKDYVDQFVAHDDRSPIAEVPIRRELNAAIELLIRLLRKYYGVLARSDIDVIVDYPEDPLAIFRFAWVEA